MNACIYFVSFPIQWSVMLTLLPRLLTLSRRRTVPSPPPEGARCLHEQRKPCIKDLTGFLCKPRNISLFLSLFYFLIIDSGPPCSGPLKDLNIGERVSPFWLSPKDVLVLLPHELGALCTIWVAVINSFTLSLCGPIPNRPQTCTCWRPPWKWMD